MEKELEKAIKKFCLLRRPNQTAGYGKLVSKEKLLLILFVLLILSVHGILYVLLCISH